MDLLSCFDGNGKSLKKGTLANGNGTVRNYNQNGKLINTVTLTEGFNIKGNWNDAQQLNSFAWNTYENVNDKDKLARAITWAKRAIKLEETSANLDTHAALLYKTGDFNKALIIANKAIAKAKKEEKDYSLTIELIKKINASSKQ